MAVKSITRSMTGLKHKSIEFTTRLVKARFRRPRDDKAVRVTAFLIQNWLSRTGQQLD